MKKFSFSLFKINYLNASLLTILVTVLLVSCGGDEPEGGGNNNTKLYQYVDLGLPSGTLWAVMNVGATKPEELGSLFAWGETSPKQFVYEWGTYKWCHIDGFNLTKYCYNSSYGIVDYKTELAPADDAAYVNWGSSWRMPRKEQIEELISYCTWQRTTLNGVKGFLVSSNNNNNSMFLPAVGEEEGIYWTRDLNTGNPDKAYVLYLVVFDFTTEPYLHKQLFSAERYSGHCVRAVRVASN